MTDPDDTQYELPRIQPRVLRHEVLAALRNAILKNEISPGSRLLEADVATRMGVSRAPVREAIRHLEQEGLIEFIPHRGAMVIGLPEREVGAIYELRAVVEGRAMEGAAGHVEPGQLQLLERLVDEMRTAVAAKRFDSVAEIDLRFHGLIVEWSGMTLLRHMWLSLDGLVRVGLYQALSRPGKNARYFLNEADSHLELIAALRAGNPKRAAVAARQHVLKDPSFLAGLKAPARARSEDPIRSSRAK